MRVLTLLTITALLVPAMQLVGGSHALNAQSSQHRQPLKALGTDEPPPLPPEPWDLNPAETLSPLGPLQSVEPLQWVAEPPQILAQTGSQLTEAVRLINQGIELLNRGRFRDSIPLFEEALEILQAVEHLQGQGAALINLGIAYGSLAQYERAIGFYEQSLGIVREIGNREGEGAVLGSLGNTYSILGQYDLAIDLYQQHLAIAREIGDREGEGAALGGLGIAYRNLGQYDLAIDLYQQRLAIAREIGDREGEGAALGNLGNIYNILGQYDLAIEFSEQALVLFRELDNRAGEGRVLGNLGNTYGHLGQYERAIDLYEQQLTITREIGDRAGEGTTLGNLGVAYASLDQYERALEQYGQAIILLNALGARSEEALFLRNIGKLLDDQAQPELAIVFLKASVEVRESIRGDISDLSTDLQQSFTDTVAADYRRLADLLLQQNRIIEAQRVLDLLKVQELDDYLQDVQRNAQTETGVDFWQPEERILALHQDVLLAGNELTRLRNLNPASLSPDEQARLAELTAQQDQLYTSFVDWLTHPEIIASIDDLRVQTRGRTIDVENFTDLQDQLAQLPQQSVILYPLILEDRLELVLVSADAPPVRYPVDVDAVTLNRAIVAFGQAIKDRGRDARGPAQQLYDWVIAPLEADLAALGTESIIFAPDGALRYVPLAALYDGDQWLVERFTFSQITAASETDFAAAAPRDRQSLLAAACADCAFTVDVGGDSVAFGHLPATRQEVNTLATQIPEATVLIDGDFTPQQFKDQLGRHNWIHLATHGFFVADDPDASFLLFGNGETVNLRQIFREWQQMDADLVVLSACETALGGPELGSGIEVLGLGFQMQRVGAKAVMASLWVVSDQGTQALMEHFYAALNQGMTKAEALQAAQLAMIRGNQVATTDDERAIAVVADTGSDENAPRRAARYSHPYYWAPFILIGNGL